MKGLLFSEPMVKAWMEGRKTVTRRLMNPQPDHCHKWPGKVLEPQFGEKEIKPRYLPGETVYIQETWAQFGLKNQSLRGKVNVIEYAADMGIERFPIGGNYTPRKEDFKWRSSRFMPEWASRSHALIISVRPERVQEITDDDALMEGFVDIRYAEKESIPFRELWKSLHPGSWERNDFVFRYELKKV